MLAHQYGKDESETYYSVVRVDIEAFLTEMSKCRKVGRHHVWFITTAAANATFIKSGTATSMMSGMAIAVATVSAKTVIHVYTSVKATYRK